jgi:hypothetical protein
VCLWDLEQPQGCLANLGRTPPGPDGLYEALEASASPVNGLCVEWLPSSAAADALHLLTCHEDGSVAGFACVA